MPDFASLRRRLGANVGLAVGFVATILPTTVVAQRPLAPAPLVVIQGATVIDGTGAEPRRDQTLIIRGDRIAALAPRGSLPVPSGARVIDGRGKWVVPGFIDMHAHFGIGEIALDTTPSGVRMRGTPDRAGGVESLRTLLAFGVTTIRNPAGETRYVVAVRDSVRLGLLPGPRIFTAGEAIDGLTATEGLSVAVKTEDEMRREVARQAALGVDYVKLYAGLPEPMIRAGVDEAHRRGVRAIAHLMATSWTDAARAGIDGIVHITPGSPRLLPAARRGEFLKGIRGTQFMLEWFHYLDPASPEIEEMLDALVRHHVFVDPTLVTFEQMAWGDSARVTQSPDLAFAPTSQLRSWRTNFTLSTGWTEADYAEARRAWPAVLAFTKLLHARGVQLTAGTDASNPWTVPGASFHRELELLVDAGIPPLEVLRIATRNGARSLGIEGDVGTVAVGKVADLVVLAGDPLADISNSRQIAWVVQGGRVSAPHTLLPARLAGKSTARTQ